MSAKKATFVTIATLFAFVMIAAGISSGGADNAAMASEDGYGISASR